MKQDPAWQIASLKWIRPIEELPRLRAALGPGAPRLLIKRDDYTGAGFGGAALTGSGMPRSAEVTGTSSSSLV